MKRALAIFGGGLLLASLAGCYDETVHVRDPYPPRAPSGVYSVTGDERVTIYWDENPEEDLAGYNVYWNDEPTGRFELVATTRKTWYTDEDVRNGTTYYYTVSAVDDWGNESELSREDVHDTPRPEGFDLILYTVDSDDEALSGYDFSRFQRTWWDEPLADVFVTRVNGRFYLNAGKVRTDLQDAGFVPLVDVDWAPEGGWIEQGRVELVEGHSYVVWTWDNHFAKVEVTDIRGDSVVLDWAYQIDEGNPELAPKKQAS
jgi:hypothetical protein